MQTENKDEPILTSISFQISIEAKKERVWTVLWDEGFYNKWTSVFAEESSAVSDWNEGSTIEFLDGKGNGMYSLIETKIPGELMVFKHLGEIKDGLQIPVNDKTSFWSGSLEKYSLTENEGITELKIELDSTKEFVDYFTEAFPKALQKIKELAESRTQITVKATIDAPLDKVWEYWNGPSHITKWYSASDEWHTPTAENDLRVGEKFLYRMEAKDGSMGFDFVGKYDEINTNELIRYTLADCRKVTITFSEQDNQTKLVETFEAEDENSIQLQHDGWQAILNNFKKYVETN